VKKEIIIDPRAEKEIKDFPREVKVEIHRLVRILRDGGVLTEPEGRKLIGHNNLFEIRVRYKGQWRVVYAYYLEKFIILLTAFQKKTQKTPTQIIKKAFNRLKLYSSK